MPADRRFASWAWELLDLDGTPLAPLVPASVRLERALNSAAVCRLTVPADMPGADEITGTAALVRGWRAPPGSTTRVVRFGGVVSSVSASVSAGAVTSLEVVAHDPFETFAARAIQAEVTYTADYPRDIVAALVALQNARGTTHMRVAAGTGGPTRDRTYERGKRAGDAVQQLAEVLDGFYFVVNPVADPLAPEIVGEFVLRYPAPGGTANAARFEFGAGTLGNLAAAKVDRLRPINSVLALGAGVGAEQLATVRTDAGSIAANGLHEAVISHLDVTVLATLEAHADDALRPDGRVTVSATPLTGVDATGVYVPRPWDDFDLGDEVPVVVRESSPAASFDGTAVVSSVAVEVGASGVERLAGVGMVTDA